MAAAAAKALQTQKERIVIKKLLAVIGCLILLLSGLGLYVWNQYDGLDTTAIPVITVKLDGQEVSCMDRTFQAALFWGVLKKELTDSKTGAPITLQSARPQIEIAAPCGAAATLTLLQEGRPVFSGTKEEWNESVFFTYHDNGEYLLCAEGTVNLAEGAGTFSIQQAVTVELPRPAPSLTLTPQKITQGGMAVLRTQYYPEDTVFQAESTLGMITFTQSGAEEWAAVVPAGYMQQPGEYTVTVTAGEEVTQLTLTVEKRDFEVQHLEVEETIANETWDSAAANWEFSQKVVPFYYTADSQLYWRGRFAFPLQDAYRVTTPFGVIRYINDDPSPVRHGAWDFAAPLGTPVYASGDGKVEVAEFLQLSGNTVVIEYGGGLKSYFYHMDSLTVEAGQLVKQGEKLGEVGTTGFSTGPHLHCEFKVGKQSVDPWPLFEGTSVILETQANA